MRVSISVNRPTFSDYIHLLIMAPIRRLDGIKWIWEDFLMLVKWHFISSKSPFFITQPGIPYSRSCLTSGQAQFQVHIWSNQIHSRMILSIENFHILEITSKSKQVMKHPPLWYLWHLTHKAITHSLLGQNQHPRPFLKTRKQEHSFGTKIDGIFWFMVEDMSVLAQFLLF